MYAQKYDEEFAPHLNMLVTDVWNLLVSCGKDTKYDLVCQLSVGSVHISRLWSVIETILGVVKKF